MAVLLEGGDIFGHSEPELTFHVLTAFLQHLAFVGKPILLLHEVDKRHQIQGFFGGSAGGRYFLKVYFDVLTVLLKELLVPLEDNVSLRLQPI